MNDLRLDRAMRLHRRLRPELRPAVPVDTAAAQRAIAEDLDGRQRDLLAACWAGRCTYPYLAQSPTDTLVLQSLLVLGLIECPPTTEARGPRPSARGRAVLGRLPAPAVTR